MPKEPRTGKWQPNSEKGIWVGISSDVSHGHLVVPIAWDTVTLTWTLYPTVTATTVIVYDSIFRLRMGPSASPTPSVDFDSFTESVFEPYLLEDVELQSEQLTAPLAPVPSTSVSEVEGEHHEVERIKKRRVRFGQVQYLVKWVGFNNRFNCWKSIDDLQCEQLVRDFESRQFESACLITPLTALECDAVVDSQFFSVVWGR